MPVIQSPGISSGIDINGLVAQLVAAERAPQEQRIGRTQSRLDTQISALGTLKSALSTLSTSLNSLKTETSFQTRKAESEDKTVFTATATASAAAGSYSVEVLARASAQKLASAAVAGGSGVAVGNGTLTIAVGGNSFDVAIVAGQDSLAAIRDAINAAPNNSGVSATTITGTAGAQLVLTARQSGATNTIRVTTTGGDGGLNTLVYDPGVTTNLTQLTAAADAQLRIDGANVTSPTSVVTGALDGVSINIVAARPGTVLALNVSNDTTAAAERVKKFVTDFNSAALTIATLRRYDAATKQAGPLLGDAQLRGIEAGMRGDLSTTVGTAVVPYDTLASIGITTNADGTLKLNDAKLSAALGANFDAVGKLFGSVEGVAARLFARVDDAVKSDSALAGRTESLERRKKALDADRDVLDRRMTALETRYRSQFSAMDRLLAQLQTTGNFLTQQLRR
jgi:flagellar hook-associated protein 2